MITLMYNKNVRFVNRMVIMSAIPQHNLNPGEVKIDDIQDYGNQTFKITVSLSGHKFSVLYKTDLNSTQLKASQAFKERVAQMASVSLTVKDFYEERNKHKSFSIQSSPGSETRITSEKGSKTIQQFITQKQTKIDTNTSYAGSDKAKLRSIISNLDAINKKVLGVHDAPLREEEMSIAAVAPPSTNPVPLAPGEMAIGPNKPVSAPAAKPLSSKDPLPFTPDPPPSVTKTDKANIAQTTLHACKYGYINSKGEQIKIAEPSCNRVEQIQDLGKPVSSHKTELKCVNQDTFACGLHIQSLIQNDPSRKVCVLDMMNAYTAGGGFLNGASAQEEDLCRRSNLYPALKTLITSDKHLREDQAIVVKAQVFRDEKYQVLDKPVPLDIVGVAGLNNKYKAESSPKSIEDQEKRTIAIITQMLRTMASNGYTDVVLGALSCGAFNTPPGIVAECFRIVLEKDEFKGRFITVSFAVSGDEKNRTAFENMCKNPQTPIPNPIKLQYDAYSHSLKYFPKNLLKDLPDNIKTLPELYIHIGELHELYCSPTNPKNIPVNKADECRKIIKDFALAVLEGNQSAKNLYEEYNKRLQGLLV